MFVTFVILGIAVFSLTPDYVPLDEITHKSFDATKHLADIDFAAKTAIEICNVAASKKEKSKCLVDATTLKERMMPDHNARKETDDIITTNFQALVTECRNGVTGKT